jgi:tripartite-type tricarboxylate transporter receptor subunit TctC
VNYSWLMPAQAGIRSDFPVSRKRAAFSSILALFIAFVAVAPAHAEDVASFYRGKQIRFIVGSAPGGTYDLVARAVARHMAAHIPGDPSIIVENQPAASGLVMTNQLYALGPKDGTVVGVPLNGIPAAPLLKPNLAHYDAGKLIWLGSTTREPYVAYVWHTAPVQTLSQLLTEPLVVGGTTPGSTMVDFPQLTNAILGTKFKIVPGYGSTPLMNEAMERGETQGVAALGWEAVKAQLAHFLADKEVKVIAQFGLHQSAILPDVPLMIDLARTPADRRALALLFSRTEIGRPLFLPPGVPANRVEALRRAFDATMKDKAFLADAKKLGLDVDPLTGEQVQKLVADLASTPADTVARVRAALNEK